MGGNIRNIIVSVGQSDVHGTADGRDLVLLATLIAINELVLVSLCNIEMLIVTEYTVLVSLRQSEHAYASQAVTRPVFCRLQYNLEVKSCHRGCDVLPTRTRISLVVFLTACRVAA